MYSMYVHTYDVIFALHKNEMLILFAYVWSTYLHENANITVEIRILLTTLLNKPWSSNTVIILHVEYETYTKNAL